VLCTRVRLEEKRMIAALGSLGVEVKPFPPSDAPLPVGPLSAQAGSGDVTAECIQVVIDRLQERATASVWLPYWRHSGREMIDGGIAATHDRLAVARMFAEAGLPRPETAVVISESCGLNAVDLFDGTATLLPIQTGARELPLLDRESAEAILEHRSVLGEAPDSISLIQQGIATAGNRVTVTTVGGHAIAASGSVVGDASMVRSAQLAETTACLLGARLLGVTLAEIDGKLVVWDVDPVPAFRDAMPLNGTTVEAALAALTAQLLETPAAIDGPVMQFREEAGDHVFLSA
jgi:[lysine-biosynthesis-protein LysW]---L-2-aminoadipate ligase